MALSAGTRIGAYEVGEQIGAGGMGVVYRARDTKLKRLVAIKVLPEAIAADPAPLMRFQREAEVLAALNHPHIAAIYGLEDAGESKALIMELVDGPTLAEVIRGSERAGPGAGSPRGLPLGHALGIARQVAEALEAAHEQGIIHRDLKPANVKVRPDGTVKVLDFGLAKIIDPSGTTSMDGASTTMTPLSVTERGMILGTAAYMSPEQARGKPVDRRTDVWAFGCVLYEMLTGRRAFEGDETSDTLALIITQEPDWNALPAACPPSIRRLLRRCLRKDRAERLPDIGAARLEIRDQLEAPPDLDGPPAASSRWRRVAAVAALAVVGVAIGATALLWDRVQPSVAQSVTRWTTADPRGVWSPVVGTSSRRLVYVGSWGTQLFARPFDRLDPTPVGPPGSIIRGLFMSPDEAWVGFFDAIPEGTVLRKVAITGGPVTDICVLAGAPRGATWAHDGTIVFATDDETGLLRVSASGVSVRRTPS